MQLIDFYFLARTFAEKLQFYFLIGSMSIGNFQNHPSGTLIFSKDFNERKIMISYSQNTAKKMNILSSKKSFQQLSFTKTQYFLASKKDTRM